MNKSDYIKGMLAISPAISNKELARRCGCTTALVTYVKRNMVQYNMENVVGVIADTHCPAEQDGYFEFIKETFKFWGVTKVVHIGDLVDFHRAARHVSEPSSMSITEELELARTAIKRWTDAFPDVSWCKGNHDMIPYRQAKEIGLSDEFIKPLHELLEIPDTWEFADNFIIDDVYYEHGLGSGGMYGAKNTSLRYRMSYVQGHTHANGGVYYNAGPNDTIFGLNVGAGCDSKHISQFYGRNYKSKITLGCGIVVNGEAGYFVPMT